jgi:hypothetical protein
MLQPLCSKKHGELITLRFFPLVLRRPAIVTGKKKKKKFVGTPPQRQNALRSIQKKKHTLCEGVPRKLSLSQMMPKKKIKRDLEYSSLNPS